MKYLHSIEPIQKVFYTQREPVLVRCNDLKYYVCKHSIYAPCDTLFNEFIATKFLDIWGIYALQPSFISITKNHLPDGFVSSKLQPASFKHTLIGYPYLKDSKEINLFDSGFKNNLTDRGKIVSPKSLIDIALFDLWVGNDDRNWNNYNLLLESKDNGFYIVPIDHETIFNTNSLLNGITLQTESDSLINTPLFNAIITKSLIKNIFKEEKNIRENFYLCTEKCKKHLDKILEELPHDWNISIDSKRELILKNIFSSKWLNDVFQEFLIYLKQQL